MKIIGFPDRAELLAEFLGTCFGDGCLSVSEKKHDYCLYITGHTVDDEFYMKTYLPQIIKNLFGIECKLRKQKGNTLILYTRSKELVKFLNKEGMQIGRKNDLNIPEWIKSKPSLMTAFLRGFVDTDGCLTFKKRYKESHYYPTISVSSINNNIILDLHRFLNDSGFKVGKIVKSMDSVKGYDKLYPHFRIYLYGEKNLEKWIGLIGFSNMKHMSKYLTWKKMGHSPSYSSTPSRIKIIKNPPSEI